MKKVTSKLKGQFAITTNQYSFVRKTERVLCSLMFYCWERKVIDPFNIIWQLVMHNQWVVCWLCCCCEGSKNKPYLSFSGASFSRSFVLAKLWWQSDFFKEVGGGRRFRVHICEIGGRYCRITNLHKCKKILRFIIIQ